MKRAFTEYGKRRGVRPSEGVSPLRNVKFLFWNLGKRSLGVQVADLVQEHEVDVLVLAECSIPIVELLQRLNSGNQSSALFSVPPNPASSLTILTRFPTNSVKLVRDLPGVAIRELALPAALSILMVGLHLPSKLWQSETDQALLITRVARYIEEDETRYGHQRTIMFGDFNMNPFEVGMVAAEGFHAVMDRRVARKTKRQVQGEDRYFFYNPMWGFLGDSSPGPSGTYYYDSGRQVNYYWNMFDQVVIRPSLLDRFQFGELKIATKAGSFELLRKNKSPNTKAGSDHLPLLFAIDLEAN